MLVVACDMIKKLLSTHCKTQLVGQLVSWSGSITRVLQWVTSIVSTLTAIIRGHCLMLGVTVCVIMVTDVMCMLSIRMMLPE